MRRCCYCPSTEFHLCRFQPADVLLIVFGVRRRCEYCGRQQFHWWIPRPVRWVLAVVLVLGAYVASAAVVGQSKITLATERRLKTWVYPPLVVVASDTDFERLQGAKPYFEWLKRDETAPGDNKNAPVKPTSSQTVDDMDNLPSGPDLAPRTRWRLDRSNEQRETPSEDSGAEGILHEVAKPPQ